MKLGLVLSKTMLECGVEEFACCVRHERKVSESGGFGGCADEVETDRKTKAAKR